jgi:hypothetical protein
LKEERLAMTLNDLIARVRRLEKLTQGLALEVALWKECNDPLLYLERKAYLHSIQDALAAAERARQILAGTCQRLGSKAVPGAVHRN